MTATTVTALQVFHEVAARAGLLKGSLVTTVASKALTLRDAPTTTGTNYTGAIVTAYGRTFTRCTGYTASTQVMAIESDLTPTLVGNADYVSWTLWKGLQRVMAQIAVNEAIDALWPDWFREMTVTSTSTITLASGTYTYALPTDCVQLSGVRHAGTAGDTDDAINWQLADNVWRMEGDEGARVIRFLKYPRGGNYPLSWSGEKLYLHYEAREPRLTIEYRGGAVSGAVSNGAPGLIRLTMTAHNLTTGYSITVAGVGGCTEANATWVVTVIDANTVDLVGSTFAHAFTTAGTWTLVAGSGFVTEFPLDAVVPVAAETLVRNGIYALADDLQNIGVLLPQLQLEAGKARERLSRHARPRLPYREYVTS